MNSNMQVGDYVIACRTVTENGKSELADANALFPQGNYIHALVGDVGCVQHVEFDRSQQLTTVRFLRTRTATLVKEELGDEVDFLDPQVGLKRALQKPTVVGPNGFVRLVDYMGDDNAVPQAARVSYGAGTKTVLEDAQLMRFLMRNEHFSPFAMCQVKLHVRLPIFVHAQFVR